MIDQRLLNHDAVIIANGDVLDKKLLMPIINNKFIIAADGAYDKCSILDIEPNVIIGDNDSIKKSIKNYTYIDDQNSTDLEKAIIFAKNRNFDKLLIIGAFGGELDHSLNNLMSLSRYLSKNVNFTIIDQYSENKFKFGILLYENSINFECREKSTISILPLDNAIVSSIGLNWELNNYQLNFNGRTSARNFAISSDVTINCITGKVVVLIDYS